jgi:hypothetical protein
LRYQEEKMSLRPHEKELTDFLNGLGLCRRTSRELANSICEFQEVCEALKELVDDNALKRKDKDRKVRRDEEADSRDHQ